MSYLDDRESLQRQSRADARKERERADQFRKDVQDVMGMPAMRRLLSEFMDTAGLDRSAYREDAGAMAFSVGWQDAARWWLDAVREHCPEKETTMRAEARARAKQEAQPGDSSEEDDASS